MPLGPGTKLGPYEIVGTLGAGGMGEVYRARNTRLDRTVAIKILPAHLSADPVRKQRFEREAKSISQLNHPNICTLYDIGSQDGIELHQTAGQKIQQKLDVALLSSKSNFPFLLLNCTEVVPSLWNLSIFLLKCNAASSLGKYTKAEDSPA